MAQKFGYLSTLMESQLNSPEVGARPGIAALREDCSQSLDCICNALQARGIQKVYILAENCRSNFIVWAVNVGADSRVLDHRLRRSPRLADEVAKSLDQLKTTLSQVRSEVLVEGDPDGGIHTPSADRLDDVISSQTDVHEDELMYEMSRAQHLIDSLSRFLPSLQNPEEDWTVTADASTKEGDKAAKWFPRASPWLRERLTNSDRRRNLWIRPDFNYARVTPYRDLLHSISQGGRLRNHEAPSETGVSTAASIARGTVFSTETRQSTGNKTSIARSLSEKPEAIRVLLPPQAPITLPTCSPFTCSICQFELPFGTGELTNDDWVNHVYLDIEPYVCTSRPCTQAHKTFGNWKDWFHHEIREHRSKEVWRCRGPTCTNLFETPTELERHLRSQHPEVFSSTHDLASVIEHIGNVSFEPPNVDICPLCEDPSDSTKQWQEHVRHHLEQFALDTLHHILENHSDKDHTDRMSEKQREVMLSRFLEDEDEDFAPNLQMSGSGKSKMQKGLHHILQKNEDRKDRSRPDSTDSSYQNDGADAQTPNLNDRGWREAKIQTYLAHDYTRGNSDGIDSLVSPRHFNVPPRNTGFVGRVKELSKIHAVLSSPGYVCLLTGPGGVGKTAIAVEYLYSFERDFTSIFWVETETADVRAQMDGFIAADVGAEGQHKLGEKALINLVREHLTTTDKRWLLVFDNVESWEKVTQFIPRHMAESQGSILITSRQSHLVSSPQENHREIALDVFTPEESTQLLIASMDGKLALATPETLRYHPKYLAAERASELVGQLPLALSLISGYLSTGTSLSEFLEVWDERESRSRTRKIVHNADHTEMDPSIDALWDIGVRELGEDHRNLLNIFSLLDSEAIHKSFLIGNHEEPLLDFLNDWETARFRRTISQLSSRKLIAVSNDKDGQDVYKMHRLLQQKILADLAGPKFSEYFKSVFHLIRENLPEASAIQVPEPQKWAKHKTVMPHVVSLLRNYRRGPWIKPSLDLAQLFYDAGFHAWEQQTTVHHGKSFLLAAEAMLDEISYDRDAKLRADIHAIIADWCNSLLDERDEALRRAEMALDIRRKIYDQCAEPKDRAKDMLYRNATNDLALILLNQNKFMETIPLYESCLKQYRIWGTEAVLPFEYAKYYVNHGAVKMWRGEYTEAIRSLEKALALLEQHSTETWHYWKYKFFLGCVMLQSGSIQDAKAVHLQALDSRVRLFGRYDEGSISSTYAVGAMYHHLHELDTARHYLVECIERYKIAGVSEEGLGRAQYHLALIYRELGTDEGTAQKLESEGLAVLDKYAAQLPPHLQCVDSAMMKLDALQRALEGRFTGIELLKHLHEGVTN
ncbi:hypothetical protein BX600DRAFT_507102 [Xylariales sp. PMI_506]|nr:hypothetical protein BX600DRAFT_507102 [Xylariales sp. PMI_506]